MKILRLAVILGLGLSLSACAKSKVIDGVEYQPYGLANEDVHRNPNIQYELVLGNVILSFILFETVVVPVYLVGWEIMQPVAKKVPETERH